MKRKAIRFISLLLICTLLLPAIPAAQAEDLEYKWILVDYFGARHRSQVLQDANGDFYAPLSWLLRYCTVLKEEKEDYHVYYHMDEKEERTFAKRLFLKPETGEFLVGIYFGKSALKDKTREYGNYYPLYEGAFSDRIEQDGEIWVPIAELLPLMEVEATVGDDGYLYMRPVVMTTFRALYEHSGKVDKNLLFDADSQISYDELLSVVGRTIDSILSMRPDGGVLFRKEAMQNDYQEVFKTYLMDDEIFLKTFGAEGDMFKDYLHNMFGGDTNGEEETQTLIGIVEGVFKTEAVESIFSFDPDRYKQGTEGLEKTFKGIEGIVSLYCYADIYFNHIDDHRRMLDAVYRYEKAIAKKPSGKAAISVSEIYNRNADNSEALFREAIRDIVEEGLSSLTPEEVLTPLVPWYLAVEATRIIVPEEMDYVSAVRLIPSVDNTVSYSFDIYKKRLKAADFSEDGLENIRLCLMMSLVGSRFAYDTYWKNGKEEEQRVIEEILADLYIAGLFREQDNSDTFQNLKKRYSEETENLIAEDPAISAEMGKLEYSHALSLFEWGRCSGVKWTLVDADSDGEEELLVQGRLETETPLGVMELPFAYIADATSGRNICYTPLLGVLVPEYMTAGGQWYLKDGNQFYTWGGVNWNPVTAPEGAAEAVFDNPSLKQFSMEGDGEALLESAQRYCENQRDCTGVFRTDLDADGRQDLLAVFADPGNRWSNIMEIRDGLTYDVDLRTDGLTGFLAVLARPYGADVRMGMEFWEDNAPAEWNEAEKLLQMGGFTWKYREDDDRVMVIESDPSLIFPQIALVDLVGLPSEFACSYLRECTEYDSVEAFLAACEYSGSGAVPLGSGRVATGYLNNDFVYMVFETVDGYEEVCQVGMDCRNQSAEIINGVPSSMDHTEFFDAVWESMGECSPLEPVYGPDGEITAYMEMFTYFRPGAPVPYTAYLLLEDEFHDSYIHSIHFVRQPA